MLLVEREGYTMQDTLGDGALADRHYTNALVGALQRNEWRRTSPYPAVGLGDDPLVWRERPLGPRLLEAHAPELSHALGYVPAVRVTLTQDAYRRVLLWLPDRLICPDCRFRPFHGPWRSHGTRRCALAYLTQSGQRLYRTHSDGLMLNTRHGYAPGHAEVAAALFEAATVWA